MATAEATPHRHRGQLLRQSRGRGPVRRGADRGRVAGIHLEDGIGAPDLWWAKIARIRQVARGLGVELFVNARIDIYLRGLVPEVGRLAETCARAMRYRDAGASGIFVPGLAEPSVIASIARATDLPVNLLAWPGLPPALALVRRGVRRLSAGRRSHRPLWAARRRWRLLSCARWAPQRPGRGRDDPPRHERAPRPAGRRLADRRRAIAVAAPAAAAPAGRQRLALALVAHCVHARIAVAAAATCGARTSSSAIAAGCQGRSDARAWQARTRWRPGGGRGQPGMEASHKLENLAEGERKALLMFLGTSGLSVTAEERAMIEGCTDPKKLEQWIARAASAGSVGEVLGRNRKPRTAKSRTRPRARR